MTRKIYKISQDHKLWEQYPWETAKAYQAFFLYYFPQTRRPRSVAQAYRQANPAKAPKTGKDSRQAPSNWIRWSQGRTPQRDHIYHNVIFDDGRQELQQAPTWAERAKAWDTHIYQEQADKKKQQEKEVADKIFNMLQTATNRLTTSWAMYNPGGEDIRALMQATKTLVDSLDKVAHLWGDPSDPGDAQDDDSTPIDERVTDLDRIDQIASILQKAKTRRDDSQ